jgi:hypothetical protein
MSKTQEAISPFAFPNTQEVIPLIIVKPESGGRPQTAALTMTATKLSPNSGRNLLLKTLTRGLSLRSLKHAVLSCMGNLFGITGRKRERKTYQHIVDPPATPTATPEIPIMVSKWVWRVGWSYGQGFIYIDVRSLTSLRI